MLCNQIQRFHRMAQFFTGSAASKIIFLTLGSHHPTKLSEAIS